jgi:tRNA threonylcarbamoyladenosine biosynthesis protein TsaE
MSKQTYISNSEKETMKIAATIAKNLRTPAFLCLHGNLGAGKTVFAKGLAKSLGIDDKKIKSPTYTFVREYKTPKGILYHFDFYRIESLDDLMAETAREIFDKKNAIILVEWPEHIKEILPAKRTEIVFEYTGENTREITVTD